MSGLEERKAKRRRHKGSSVVKTSNQTCQSFPGSLGFDLSNPAPTEILSPSLDSETMQKLEKLMDAKDDCDLPQLLPLSRGPNPYLDKERCLLCGCERNEAPDLLSVGDLGNSQKSMENALSQLPLWVCLECRKATEQGMDRKVDVTSFMDADLQPEPSPLPFLDPGLDSEPSTPNGTVCNCEACTERRQIETEHDRETQELQNCWTELRKLVRMLYGRREGDLYEEDTNVPDDESAQDSVHRLCTRDPHQLFLRLESQVREFVIEMKVKLLKQLNSGYKSPPEAKSFIQLLLDEYEHLCVVSRKMGKILEKLKTDHLSKFNVTWELHNKHLFQSIAYTEPSIQSSLHLIISQLRLGAASKESYHEDTYPNLLHRYLKFDDEMSVISVVWRDSHQLIEQYNEEQATLKLKQKMLKEDWEFFKAQRKILEEQVAKSTASPVTHSFEAQFTETMRMMLQGAKPNAEECHCPRCNRKRCPCDECTITHMITCGIINPEALEASNPGGHPTFLHDPNRYRIDVSPPSMSSTTSSSGSSSPLIHERLTLPFDESAIIREIVVDNENNKSNDGENGHNGGFSDGNTNIYDDEEDEEEDDEEEEEEDDDEDKIAEQMADMDICDDEEEEDDDDELDNYDIEYDEEDDVQGSRENSQEKSLKGIQERISPSMRLEDDDEEEEEEDEDDDDEALDDLISSEKCDCFHCKRQAQNEQKTKQEENSCKCYACLREQGNTVSTSLPQSIAAESSRPAELHLYPHIHGSPSLHGLPNHSPLLPTQLYDLHMPLRQPKSLLQTSGKVLPKLDFDSPEGIHEHMYHAYGEWDNTYDARIPFPKYSGISTDLLPPPPLTTNFSTANFLNEPFSVATQMGMETVSTTTIPTSAFKSSVSHHVSLSTPQAVANISNVSHDHSTLMVSHNDLPASSMTPPCTRPVTLGGNISQKQAGVPTNGVPSVADHKQHSQHCKRHNSTLLGKNNANCQSHNNNNPNTVKVTQELFSAARNIRENAKEGMQMIRQFANSLNANSNTHSCNHGNRNASNHVHQPTPDHNHCPNGVSMPTTVNNVSVGTSTVCMEPNCNNHCGDDNCDSVDDSCSEQSSSTSTSNQKEGKYCDCCYCEFFGHGNPPVAPTSKNYEEMRNRLRLRLKRKQQSEKKQDPHYQNCIMVNSNHNNNSPARPVKVVQVEECPKEDPVAGKGLDELLNFINGTENKDQAPEKSSKALKRARQKQRKAEEKARMEAERIKKEQEEAEKERQRLAMIELEEREKAAQKKKKKKKKKGSDGTSSVDSDLKLVREPPAGKEDDTDLAQREKSKSSAKKSASNTSQPVGKVKDTSNNAISPRNTEKTASVPVSNTPKSAKEKNDKSSLPDNVRKQADNKRIPVMNGNDKNANYKSKTVIEEVLEQNAKKMKKSVINQGNISQLVSVATQPAKSAVRTTIAQPVQQPMKAQKQQNQHCHEELPKSVSVSKQTTQSQKQCVPQSPQPNRQPVPSARHHQISEGVKMMQHPPDLHPPFSKISKLSKLTPEEISKQQTLAAQLIAKQQQQQPLPQKHVPRQNGVPAGSSHHVPASTQQNHIIRPCVVQNGKTGFPHGMNGLMFRQPPPPPVFSPPTSLLPKSQPDSKKNNAVKLEDSPPDQGKSGKNKKKNKKNRNSEDLSVIDEIFMPKADGEIDNGEMDEVEKELEEFKRFCLNNTPVKREKLQVNMNLKDIFAKKKSGLGCS